ncbi:MAG: hypothetical protein FJ386_00695 [Verrucomicrobia bacterium]|nr:hypothetical protein [Verrucomicrobiota bacterium]
MYPIAKTIVFAGALVALSAGAPTASAQGKGNFNIEEFRARAEEFRARAMERMREAFDVKNDDEWKVLAARIEKVSEAQREARAFAIGGLGGLAMSGFGGRGPGGGGDKGGGGRPQGGGTNPFGFTPNPDIEALRKAVEEKAPSAELKSMLAKVRDARKSADAKVEKAQDDLKAVLTDRQEAQAYLFGLVR